MRTAHRSRPSPPHSAFAGFRYPPDVIVLTVRWYLRYGLSYRDVEELLTQRGSEVDHGGCSASRRRWSTPRGLPTRCRRPLAGGQTHVRVAGQWRYVYRAVDQFGQVVDVLVSAKRHMRAPPPVP